MIKTIKNKERERAYKINSKKLLTPSDNGCIIKTVRKQANKKSPGRA